MNLEEVKQFFEEQKDNEDVKSYLQGLSQVTSEGVTTFLDTEDGKKLLQPRLDSHFTKSLETWKSNNISKLIDEEVKKRFPEADPKDVEMKKLQAQLEQMQQENTREKLKAKAVTVAGEKKLPIQLVEYLIGKDEESTLGNLKTFEEVFNGQLQTLVQEKLKDGGIDPQLNNQNNNTSNMSPTQLMSAAYSQNNKN
ncbi:DUF4355 domain-containing protein [Bacillaceae bacterium C204]|uniref:DUF4355 domain-containing protein n=1 Tax=Neobacillus sp. 204 TaxID=3383351 RepID=UPI00397C06F7